MKYRTLLCLAFGSIFAGSIVYIYTICRPADWFSVFGSCLCALLWCYGVWCGMLADKIRDTSE